MNIHYNKIMSKNFKKVFFFFFCISLYFSYTDGSNKLFDKIPVVEYKLENGLSVIIVKKTSPVTAIATIVGTGSLNDPYKKSGLAHFVEHCMFEGLNKGNGFLNFTKKTGAMFNAYTGFRETVFYTIVPNDYIDQLFYMEALRLKKFFIPPKVAYNERNVVTQEALMYKNNDIIQLLLETASTIIKNCHYNIPIVGYTNEIKNLTIKDVVSFIKKYYIPSNIKLIIVSDLKTEEILEKVKKYFGTIKKQNFKINSKNISVEKNDFRYNITKKSSQVGKPIIFFTYHIREELSHKEELAIRLICNILSAHYEYLYNKIIKEDKIATSLEIEFNTEISGANMLPPNLIVISMLSIFDDYKKAEETLQKRIFEILKKKISKESLQNAKDTIRNSTTQYEDSFISLFSLLQKLGTKYSYKYYNEEISLLDEIDVEYINSIFQKYFGQLPNAISVITPQGGSNA